MNIHESYIALIRVSNAVKPIARTRQRIGNAIFAVHVQIRER